MSFFEELKRRNVFRVGIAYAIASWLLLQLSDILVPLLNLPESAQRFVLLLLVIGFIPALIFAWAFEMTPGGLKKEKDVDRGSSIAPQTGRKLDRTIIVILVVALGWFAWDKFYSFPDSSPEIQPVQTAADVSESTVTAPSTNVVSIAVLPFTNMSEDAGNEYFSDGISEEILNVLASIPDLKVAARTSAFAYKGTNTNISKIAEELGVNHILEGSVRKSGNQVRVTAQLIKADDGFHLWSANYDRELTNIFAIQDEIAGSIADALKVSLELESGTAGNLTGTNSIDAYEHYLKGMSLWHLRTAESLPLAVEEFDKAIELDPRFAKAYAGLSLTWAVFDGYLVVDSSIVRKKAIDAANTALSLDSNNVEALSALANVFSAQFRYQEAGKLFTKVISLNPSFATAHQWYGNMLGFMGNPQAGLVSLQKAWSLDPRSRIIGSNLAITLNNLGHHKEAVDLIKEVRGFAPDFPDALELLMHTEMEAGDCSNTAKYGKELSAMLNKATNSTQVYVDLCQNSDPAIRARAIEDILSWPPLDFANPDNPSLSYQVELINTMVELGEIETAIILLEKNMGFDGGYVFKQMRARKSENTIAFYCDPRVQSLYEKYDIPALENDSTCD